MEHTSNIPNREPYGSVCIRDLSSFSRHIISNIILPSHHQSSLLISLKIYSAYINGQLTWPGIAFTSHFRCDTGYPLFSMNTKYYHVRKGSHLSAVEGLRWSIVDSYARRKSAVPGLQLGFFHSLTAFVGVDVHADCVGHAEQEDDWRKKPDCASETAKDNHGAVLCRSWETLSLSVTSIHSWRIIGSIGQTFCHTTAAASHCNDLPVDVRS